MIASNVYASTQRQDDAGHHNKDRNAAQRASDGPRPHNTERGSEDPKDQNPKNVAESKIRCRELPRADTKQRRCVEKSPRRELKWLTHHRIISDREQPEQEMLVAGRGRVDSGHRPRAISILHGMKGRGKLIAPFLSLRR